MPQLQSFATFEFTCLRGFSAGPVEWWVGWRALNDNINFTAQIFDCASGYEHAVI
jgi:hypothetical protein